jgi:pimeloyl-ACP methyl ester carboxylesterase
MAAFTEERHDINGIDTAVLTAGEGPPLVFFHGGGTMTGFDALLPLAENARLIVPQHPGFGTSVDDPSIDSLQDYHLHYLDLFEQMGLGEISLAGLSLGGALAAWFAIQQPGRVRRLALAAPWGLRVAEHPTVDFFSIPDEQVLSYLFADLTPFAGMPMPPPPEFLADRYRESTSLARVLWKRPYDLKLQKWLHRIAAPTLLVWGESDRLVPPGQAAVWAEHIPDAQVRTFAGAGHVIFDESPEAAAAVAEFMGAGVAAA